jgi:hypothetical protein
MWGTLICTLGLLVWLKALQKDRLPEIFWVLRKKVATSTNFLGESLSLKNAQFLSQKSPFINCKGHFVGDK